MMLTISQTRLSVMNIPLAMEEKELKQLFLTAAATPGSRPKIVQVKIVRDKERTDASGKQRSRGYGFVEFADHEVRPFGVSQ